MSWGRKSLDTFRRPTILSEDTTTPIRARASFDVWTRPDTIDLHNPGQSSSKLPLSAFRSLSLPRLTSFKRPSVKSVEQYTTPQNSPRVGTFEDVAEDGSRKSFSKLRVDNDPDIFGCCGDIDENKTQKILADLPSFYDPRKQPSVTIASSPIAMPAPISVRAKRSQTCNDLNDTNRPQHPATWRNRAMSDDTSHKRLIPLHPLRKFAFLRPGARGADASSAASSGPAMPGPSILRGRASLDVPRHGTADVDVAAARPTRSSLDTPRPMLTWTKRPMYTPLPSSFSTGQIVAQSSSSINDIPASRSSLDSPRRDFQDARTAAPSRSSLDTPRRSLDESKRNLTPSRGSLDSPRRTGHLLSSPMLPCVAEEVETTTPRESVVEKPEQKKPKHSSRRKAIPENTELLDRWRREVSSIGSTCIDECSIASDERANRAEAIIAAAKARSNTLSAKATTSAPTGPLPELPRQGAEIAERAVAKSPSRAASKGAGLDKKDAKTEKSRADSKFATASVDSVLRQVFEDLAVAEQVYKRGLQPVATVQKRKSAESTSTNTSTPMMSEEYDFSLSSQRSSATFGDSVDVPAASAATSDGRPSSSVTEKYHVTHESDDDEPPTRYGTPLSMYGDVLPSSMSMPGAMPFEEEDDGSYLIRHASAKLNSLVAHSLPSPTEKVCDAETLQQPAFGSEGKMPLQARLRALF